MEKGAGKASSAGTRVVPSLEVEKQAVGGEEKMPNEGSKS